MKKIILALIITTATISCDKVKNPVIPKVTAIGAKFVNKSNKTYNNYRKILLEDYTGHRCPNCPSAASIVKNTLHPRYGDTLIVLAVHAGDLATPSGNAKFRTQDFRSAAGTSWNTNYLITSYPRGIVNRKNYNNLGQTLEKSTWASAAASARTEELIVKLELTSNYDTITRALNIDMVANFLKAYPNPTKIIIGYYQDGIIGYQDSSGIELEDYEFEHMFRGSLNGDWGTDLKTFAAAKNDTIKSSFLNIAIPDSIKGLGTKKIPVNHKNVSIVAILYDALSKDKEVLQVEKISKIGSPKN